MNSSTMPGLRRGAAAVVMVILLVLGSLIVIGTVLAGARDQDLTVARVQTLRAFYAAEAGMNMAIRELKREDDEDDDGSLGSISDDNNQSNDPSFNGASVHVQRTTSGTQITVTSRGVSGQARRTIEVVMP
jgi:Tfp pilus assembly protein PilX